MRPSCTVTVAGRNAPSTSTRSPAITRSVMGSPTAGRGESSRASFPADVGAAAIRVAPSERSRTLARVTTTTARDAAGRSAAAGRARRAAAPPDARADRRRRPRRARGVTAAVLLTVAGSAVEGGGRVDAPPWAAPADVEQRAEAAGLTMLTGEGNVLHLHEHLSVSVDGRPSSVPSHLGHRRGGRPDLADPHARPHGDRARRVGRARRPSGSGRSSPSGTSPWATGGSAATATAGRACASAMFVDGGPSAATRAGSCCGSGRTSTWS